jgi:hypothetical protein
MCSTLFLLVTTGSDEAIGRLLEETDGTRARAILFRLFAADSVVRSIRTQKTFDRPLQELSIDVQHDGSDSTTNRKISLKENLLKNGNGSLKPHEYSWAVERQHFKTLIRETVSECWLWPAAAH